MSRPRQTFSYKSSTRQWKESTIPNNHVPRRFKIPVVGFLHLLAQLCGISHVADESSPEVDKALAYSAAAAAFD